MSSSRNPQHGPMHSDLKQIQGIGHKGTKPTPVSKWKGTPGARSHSGYGGDQQPESDYAFDRGEKVYNKRERDPNTHEMKYIKRYVCCRRKHPQDQRSQYRLKDRPPGHTNASTVTDYVDEEDLEDIVVNEEEDTSEEEEAEHAHT